MTSRLLGFYASLNCSAWTFGKMKRNRGKKWCCQDHFQRTAREAFPFFFLKVPMPSLETHFYYWLVIAIIIIFAWVTFGSAHVIMLWKLASLQSLSQWQQRDLTSNALFTLEDREAFNLTVRCGRLWLELEWGSFGLAKWEISQASRDWIPSVALPALPACSDCTAHGCSSQASNLH